MRFTKCYFGKITLLLSDFGVKKNGRHVTNRVATISYTGDIISKVNYNMNKKEKRQLVLSAAFEIYWV